MTRIKRIRNRKPFIKQLIKWFGTNDGKIICYWCGEKFSIDEITLDHYIEISQGGLIFHIGNIVPACSECNNLRSNNKKLFYHKMRTKDNENRYNKR